MQQYLIWNILAYHRDANILATVKPSMNLNGHTENNLPAFTQREDHSYPCNYTLLGSGHISLKTFYHMTAHMHLFNETDAITPHIWLAHSSAANAD